MRSRAEIRDEVWGPAPEGTIRMEALRSEWEYLPENDFGVRSAYYNRDAIIDLFTELAAAKRFEALKWLAEMLQG